MKKVIVCFVLLLAFALEGFAMADSLRKVICFDQDWRFHKGEIALPGRTSVDDWHYKLIQVGGTWPTAIDIPSPDTDMQEWNKGSRIVRGADTLGKEWEQAGNLWPEGDTYFAWFCAGIPGTLAKRPVLELEDVQGAAHVYLNGIKLKEVQGRRELFMIDLASAWKEKGTNTLAILVQFKNTGGFGKKPSLFDSATLSIPSTSPISPDYDDNSWRTVEVPHDYIVELPIDQPTSDGFKRVRAWYRKTFSVPPMAPGSKVWLEFDGIYRMSRFWLNGQHIKDHTSGYVPCRIDITDSLKDGENTLAISVDPTRPEGWWYDGGGIYRHARMVIVAPVHVAPDSVFVKSSVPDPGDGITAPATIAVSLSINAATKASLNAEVRNEVLDSMNTVVAKHSEKITLSEGETAIQHEMKLADAHLWSLENPALYSMRTSVSVDGKMVDQVSTRFGIRKIEFDNERGFFLNGKSIKIKGLCNHDTHAGVGMAIPDRLHEWRLEQMKKMGANAIRCAHNMNSPALYDACDRLGILVMDEFRNLGDHHHMKTPPEETSNYLKDQIIQIKRNRNHPSIILWSLCNEEGMIANEPVGARLYKSLKDLVYQLDGTRPVTGALNHTFEKTGMAPLLDVMGFNYGSHWYEEVRERYPDKPAISTEHSAQLSTRGYYEGTRFETNGPDLFGDEEKGRLNAYSQNRMGWGELSESVWKNIVSRPWMAGVFIWTGFDYKGEPAPFGPKQGSVSSYFGIFDSCGFPKDVYWYYKSWWGNEPVIHVFPHWNWKGKEGEKINVWVHSNCETVELFLNGKSLGEKTMERNSHLEWDVVYEPGKLEARGITQNGETIIASVETTTEPAGLALGPDRTELTADGRDLAWVGVSVIDSEGRVVPTAHNKVHFSITGPGKIIGVGNGDQTSHEPDKANERSAFYGHCMVLVQTEREPGLIVLKAESEGLTPVSVTIKSK